MDDAVNDEELDQLVHDMYDPGCEKATRAYENMPLPDSELYKPTKAMINAHLERKDHSPDCFALRQPN